MIRLEMIMLTSRRKSWFVVSVLRLLLEVERRHVRHMEQILLSINVNSVAVYHSGSAGVIHISVRRAIRDNVLVIMYLGNPEISYQNVQVLLNVL
mgnify:CR=1 FL=1